MTPLVLAALLTSSMSQTAPLVGLWDSATTSRGGIGNTLEFRADGTFVEATTVIVNAYYRVIGGRLVIGEQPPGPEADPAKSVAIQLDGDVMRLTGPDGAVLRKDRLGQRGAGKPSIVGAWQYRHYTGKNAFERYTDKGSMLFRLPMTSSVGRYVLKGDRLVLSGPNQADVTMKVVLDGDKLTLSTNGQTSTYRRDSAGPWYDREHIVK